MTPEALALERTPVITFGYIMQVFISLLVVLAFIYLIAKYLLPRLKVTAGGKLIKIIDRIYLEPQVSAYILKVGKKAWFIVTSNKTVERIDEVSEEI